MRPSTVPPTAKVIAGGRKTIHTRKLATASDGNAIHETDLSARGRTPSCNVRWYRARAFARAPLALRCTSCAATSAPTIGP